ncbi:MAG TPA: gamma-glutamyltransferase [Rhizomicrobium sp.]|nr:gamma-glutamyltransferase [Rhizomicrobium sp.]
MRRVLSALTGISFLLTPSFGMAAPPSANSNVAEFNGADVNQKFPPPMEASNGMAVSSQREASKAGAEILAAGGNAMDAAVAVGYALAVVHPCCGNIGGGGFATIHLANGKDTFINFREKAPEAAKSTMYQDADGNVIPGLSIHGYLAVGVPGTVMGMERMLKEYGTMTRAQVMAPAIKLADEGYVLQDGDARGYAYAAKAFAAQPNVAAVFLNNGETWKTGDRLFQKQLAATLKEISAQGPDVFYKGDIAQRVVAASQANGGILTMKDFADYTTTESAPLYCSYRGYRIISSPPPSSGGVSMCEILNILSGYPMNKMPVHSAKSVHYMVEAMRHAYVDRNFSLGDPAFVKNPIDYLLSAKHAADIRAHIDPVKATPSSEVKIGVEPHESEQTTHYSVVDKFGNAVSVTYTVNGGFGAQVIAGDTGFFLNDEMDDFTSKVGAPNMFGLVQGDNNSVQPGKRPLSSMSPTIITKNGKVFMVTGSPGGARIITITLESILNVIDHNMNVQAAVDTPRIHHQWMPDTVYIEPGALTPAAQKQLEADGYNFTENRTWGSDEAIIIGAKNRKRELFGANDSRATAGAAVGN